MKYVTIVLFILCLQVAVAIINVTGLTPSFMLPHDEWWGNIDKETLKAQQYAKGEVTGGIDLGIGDIVKSIFVFFYVCGFGIIVVPYTFTLLGVPLAIGAYLSIPVYFMYFMAFIQIVGNRTTGAMR